MFMQPKTVMDGVFGSSLNGHANLLDSGHNYGKGAEVWYTLIEKQLAAVYHALLATEPAVRPNCLIPVCAFPQ